MSETELKKYIRKLLIQHKADLIPTNKTANEIIETISKELLTRQWIYFSKQIKNYRNGF